MKNSILVGLFICHFLADYTHLSTRWMLNAKKLGTPLLPIFSHALVHSILMIIFLMFFVDINLALKLGYIQLITHFLIDIWKGKMNYYFPSLQSPSNTWHWIVFGFDQLLHTIVIILMYNYATL